MGATPSNGLACRRRAKALTDNSRLPHRFPIVCKTDLTIPTWYIRTSPHIFCRVAPQLSSQAFDTMVNLYKDLGKTANSTYCSNLFFPLQSHASSCCCASLPWSIPLPTFHSELCVCVCSCASLARGCDLASPAHSRPSMCDELTCCERTKARFKT